MTGAGIGKSLEQRFWEKVDIGADDECWEWTGATFPDGYGLLRKDGPNTGAHRISYELEHGGFEDGCVLHHCDNPPCVNPNHLYLGNKSDNLHDMYDRGQKEPMTGEDNPSAKLTASEVETIRERYEAEDVSYTALANEYGVSTSLIGTIITGETWQNQR